jgi:indolepyruvate ferredoxin oxidoreductase beta subunit
MVSLGWFKYPEDINERLHKLDIQVTVLDSSSIAHKLGNPHIANTVLLGAQSCLLDFPVELWKRVIRRNVPKGTEKLNVKAFTVGRKYMN